MRTAVPTLIALASALVPLACGSDSTAPSVGNGSGAESTGANGGSSVKVDGGAMSTAGSAGAQASGGDSGSTSAGSGGINGGGGTGVINAALTLTALAANRSVGLEWDPVAGATSYRIYSAQGAAATTADTMVEVEGTRATWVHRALTNGTEYHYAISAVDGTGESALSADISATPTGEWVLEEFGSGIFEDVSTGVPVPRVPVTERNHILLFAEGYTAADLPIFHDDADHDGAREGDVDGWIDYVFSIEPYATFREAFVVWTLPRASTAHLAEGDTAFAVPVTPGQFLATGSIDGQGETATRAWAAIDLMPVPPTDFSGGGFGSARTHTAAFLLFDPARGQASVSGRALSLRNPADDQQRISSAFGVGHAHEFTHAFASLRDEYLEDDNSAPQQWSETTNVVGTNVCGEMPWAHLIQGGANNADTAELVGAFGTAAHGYHPELVCLLNGTHDNALYYGGDGLLRTDERMCNFCREMTAYRIYSRSGVIGNDDAGFALWVNDYRPAFFQRFPFAVPTPVPQTNDVNDPAQGDPIYEACVAASMFKFQQSIVSEPASGPVTHGCVTED